MYAATGNANLPSRPLLHRFLIGPWSFRHPSFSIAVRLASATWNLAFGLFLLSFGHWVGFVPLAGSALLLWAVYILARDRSQSRRNGRR